MQFHQDLESMGYVWHCFCDLQFSNIRRTLPWLPCDRETQSHSVYCASIASCSKNCTHWVC